MEFFNFREPVNTWTHGLWMLACVPAGAFLLGRAGRDFVKFLAFMVYAVCLILCFAGSSLYHAVNLTPEWLGIAALLDYIGIYLLIAGTFTPVLLVVLRGSCRWASLAMIWGLAAAGITIRLCNVPVPDAVSTGIYILMGWTSLVVYIPVARRVSYRAMRWLWAGGLLYSLGAVLNEVNWPRLIPGVVGPHELHHLTCMAASVCHYCFMVRVAAPYEHSHPRPALLHSRPPVLQPQPS